MFFSHHGVVAPPGKQSKDKSNR